MIVDLQWNYKDIYTMQIQSCVGFTIGDNHRNGPYQSTDNPIDWSGRRLISTRNVIQSFCRRGDVDTIR